ncbi:hypothetical protein GCM10025298_33500 [Natronobiforma cellulositropha]
MTTAITLLFHRINEGLTPAETAGSSATEPTAPRAVPAAAGFTRRERVSRTNDGSVQEDSTAHFEYLRGEYSSHCKSVHT